MSNSRLFTHLQCRIAKLEHKYDRIGGFGQAVSNPEIGKVKTKSKIWRKYKLNRETHLWLLRCSFSSNHGPKIGVSQASKSCWGGTSSKFLLSGRGMRHRPFKSSYGIPNDIKRTSKCVGVLNILVHSGVWSSFLSFSWVSRFSRSASPSKLVPRSEVGSPSASSGGWYSNQSVYLL